MSTHALSFLAQYYLFNMHYLFCFLLCVLPARVSVTLSADKRDLITLNCKIFLSLLVLQKAKKRNNVFKGWVESKVTQNIFFFHVRVKSRAFLSFFLFAVPSILTQPQQRRQLLELQLQSMISTIQSCINLRISKQRVRHLLAVTEFNGNPDREASHFFSLH